MMLNVTNKILLIALCTGLLAFPYFAFSKPVAEVSIINLIATPEKYDGKYVRVIGFLRLEFEGDALYVHKTDYDNSLTRNGVWIVTNDIVTAQQEKLDKQYVLIEGTFEAENRGHMALWSGAITDIKRTMIWSEPPKSLSTK